MNIWIKIWTHICLGLIILSASPPSFAQLSVDHTEVILATKNKKLLDNSARAETPLKTIDPTKNTQHHDAIKRTISKHGLNPQNYQNLFSRDLSGDNQSLVQLLRDIKRGRKLESLFDVESGIDNNPLKPNDISIALQKLDDLDGNLSLWLDAISPQGKLYNDLSNTLDDYLEIKKNGGWPKVTLPASTESDNLHHYTDLIINRLSITHDLPENSDNLSIPELITQATMRFQERHGLFPDGIIGPDTVRALNIPVERRIDQIRDSLNKLRIADSTLSLNEYVFVNIANYTVSYKGPNQDIWTTKAIIGKVTRQTPEFYSQVKHIVANPTWTPTRRMLEEDILPKFFEDPDYLFNHDMEIFDYSGLQVDDYDIWSTLELDETFPYVVRQRASSQNPLGKVKLSFHNPYAVFLHDTPKKHLFSNIRRTFSSGCVRLENPIELSRMMLKNQDHALTAEFDEIINKGDTKHIALDHEVDIIALYLPAFTINGITKFMPDIYHDKSVQQYTEDALTPEQYTANNNEQKTIKPSINSISTF